MINKILIVFIIIFMGFAIIDSFSLVDSVVVSYSLTLAEIAAVFMIMINGSFIRSKLFYLAIVGIAIGTLFKILHWTGADDILTISLLATPIIYTIHFIGKKGRQILDILKLLSVLCYFIVTALSLNGLLDAETDYNISQASHILIGITFLCFLIIYTRKRKIPAEQ